MIETAKIVQALCFIIGKIKKADKLKLVKMLYLADKHHLIRYGRTITGDEYWAMNYGPVGSATKDILTMDKSFLSKDEFNYASRHLSKVDEYRFEPGDACEPDNLEMLSESDMESLAFVTENYGALSSHSLVILTHKYPEWAQYKELFGKRRTRRERIRTEELISSIPGDSTDPMLMPEAHMRESRNILTGREI